MKYMLRIYDTLRTDDRMADHHRLQAVRVHLLEMAGDDGATARRTASIPERRYLEARAARLT